MKFTTVRESWRGWNAVPGGRALDDAETPATSADARRAPLHEVADAFERAVAGGDHARVTEMLEHDILSIWFAVEPSRLAAIFAKLERDGALETGFPRDAYRMLFHELGGDEGTDEGAGAGGDEGTDEGAAEMRDPAPGANASASAGMGLISRTIRLRMAGRAPEALRRFEAFGKDHGPLHRMLTLHRGWAQFIVVQHGITAMYAGDFTGALVEFAEARRHASTPGLAFFTRDACVKAALIESIYGDAERARTLLDEADGIPHSGSWAELEIDAAHAIAASQVRAADPDDALRMLESIRIDYLGELWPFYAAAAQRVCWSTGRPEEYAQWLAVVERLGAYQTEGEGYSGSVLAITVATSRLRAGDVAAAREHRICGC